MTNFWTDILIPVLILLVLGFLYFTVKNLLPSYFNEKGKNLATKQDISQLTELVEAVKHTFTKETERLRANLQFLNNIHGGLVLEERNAIVDFNEKYFTWLNTLMDTGFGGIDDYDDLEIEKYRRLLAQQFNSFLNSHSRFDLFIENTELVVAAHNLKIETLKLLGSQPQKHLLEIRRQNVELDYIKKTHVNNQAEKAKPLIDQRLQLHKQYTSEMVDNYKIIAPMASTFQQLCRDYMYDLIEKENKGSGE
jgi:hypothetical protein